MFWCVCVCMRVSWPWGMREWAFCVKFLFCEVRIFLFAGGGEGGFWVA